ncbi:glycosyltransferase family 25 protein [Castellaniella sp.]|uniref:glycosyltransferase family 25 protein n=1 Tax=Castellaniella sp. TaxID=1955812 RepID=UPI002AFE2E08|nr:glycosyltransferase family 25 protein [Castellaniella sp.]
MTPIPIRIINLPARADRRERIAAQLAALGPYPYRFFEAIHGARQPDHPLFHHYDAAARARAKGRNNPLKPSQLGCFASHYLLWQECAESGESLIVIEDDAILLPNFQDFLARASVMAAHWPLVWLHDNDKPGRDPSIAVERIGPFVLHKKLKGHFRTVAYLITPQGARSLLRHCASWIYPVDDTMIRFYEHGVESIALQPCCVTQDDESASDITGPAARPRRALADKLRRETHHLSDQVRRAIHNLRFRLHHRRIPL